MSAPMWHRHWCAASVVVENRSAGLAVLLSGNCYPDGGFEIFSKSAGLSDRKRMKPLQPLPGLQFTCNTTSLAMMNGTHAPRRALPTPCEDEASPYSLSGCAQSLQLRSSSPIHRAPSCFDPFHTRCDRLAQARSRRLFTALDNTSPSCNLQQSSCIARIQSQHGDIDPPSAPPRATIVQVNTSADAPLPALDIINVQSCNTILTDSQNFYTTSPRSLQTPRINCSRPSAPTTEAFQTIFSSPPARLQHACMAADEDRSPSYTPTCKTPEQQPCQQRGLEDPRLCAPYRSSPLPLRIEGIRRFDCSNSSDEDDEDDEKHARDPSRSMDNTPPGADSFGMRSRPFRLLPPPLLQRLSPPDRRSSDAGSSGAGRLVCNLVERFNNTQLYDALNSPP